MGQHINLLVLQKDEDETVVDFTKNLMKQLSFKIKQVLAKDDYNTLYTELFFDSNQQCRIAVGQKGNFVILFEEADRLIIWDRLQHIIDSTKNNDKTVFWMMESDTVDISIYYFYKNGEILRSVEYGDDGIEEEPSDEPRLSGEELPYEKDGLFPLAVLKNYVHDYCDFNALDWYLLEVDDLLG